MKGRGKRSGEEVYREKDSPYNEKRLSVNQNVPFAPGELGVLSNLEPGMGLSPSF